MHELSIALSIVDIAEEEARKAGTEKFDAIELEIGELSGIVYEALEFAMEEAVKNSVLENARRKIIRIEGKAKCLQCGNIYHIADVYTCCPKCNEFEKDILQGKELSVKTLKINQSKPE